MSAHIIPYEQIKNDPVLLEQVQDIFFESSTKKEFKDANDKEAFYDKYLGFYLKHYPELAWVAMDDKVLGYVVAAPSSQRDDLMSIQPHLKEFESYFEAYPAHLHINCHRDSRGKGIGGLLVKAVETGLKARNIHGVHIMTGPDAFNKKFYLKLGFDFEVLKDFHASPILFMGKSL